VAARIERAPTIGRPLGAPEWIAMLERRLGRPLAAGKPGPKPCAERDSARQARLLFLYLRVNCHRNAPAEHALMTPGGALPPGGFRCVFDAR
jgi:hypothetical protein